MARRSPLDDPAISAHAWARYKRLMRWMAGFTLAVVIVALGLVATLIGPVPIHFYIATGLGVGVSVLLTSALMGLVFLSNGSGHDAAIGVDEDQSDGGRRR